MEHVDEAFLRQLVAVAAFALVSLSVGGAAPRASDLFLTQATASDSGATATPSTSGFAAAVEFARSRIGVVSFAVLGTDGRLRSYKRPAGLRLCERREGSLPGRVSA